MHLAKNILKGKKFKPGELKKEAREEMKEHRGNGIKKALDKVNKK